MRDELQWELKKAEERAERALHKLQLIREGLVDEILLRYPGRITLHLLGLWTQAANAQVADAQAANERREIPFHRPATQQYRPSTPDGRTTFTFQFSSVTKRPDERRKKGRGKSAASPAGKPKAERRSKPSEHATYIERPEAVAASGTLLPSGFEIPSIDAVKDHIHANRSNYAMLANVIFDGPVHELDVDFAGSAGGPLSHGPNNALSDLPGSEVDRASGGSLEGSLPADEQVGGGQWDTDQAVRRLASEPCTSLEQFLNGPLSGSVMADWYIERPGAVAVQPDGSRALLTNIDPDAAKRTEFWQLVEEHEREGKPDRMSVRFVDAPVFWQQVIAAPDCPQTLRSAYRDADHTKVAEFEIDSVSTMREFLETQPGWIKIGNRPKGMSLKEWRASRPVQQAKFHQGRGGRVQYRLIGELPHEAGRDGAFEILREFTRELEKRNLPFVAVVHAPDAHNDIKNWHFHVIFYGRPCRRIRESEIRAKVNEGLDVSRVQVGDWDFATRVPVPGRKDRWNYPFRQKKIRSVTARDRVTEKTYVDLLREHLAKVTNEYLERKGIARRFDPGSFAEMGIPVDPQEHLGTKESAKELLGIATEVGLRNEVKQDKAIRGDIEERRATARRSFALELLELRRRPGLCRREALMAVERAKVAIELEYKANLVQHEFRRSRSRAQKIFSANGQVLDAARINPGMISPRQVAKRTAVWRKAYDYLEQFDDAFYDEHRFFQEARERAKDLLEKARIDLRTAALPSPTTTVEPLAETEPVEAAQTNRHQEVFAKHGGDDAADSTSAALQPQVSLPARPAPQTDASRLEAQEWDWLDQIERERPLIVVTNKKLAVEGRDLPAGWDEPVPQEALRALLERQREEIGELVDRIRRDPDCVTRQEVPKDPARPYKLTSYGQSARRAFERYQHDAKLAAAIRQAELRQLEPERAAERSAVVVEPLIPTCDERYQGIQRDVPVEPDAASPVGRSDSDRIEVESISEPTPVLAMRDEDSVRSSTLAAESKPIVPHFDYAAFLKRVRAGELRLTITDDDRIPLNLLEKAGVPSPLAAQMREEEYFVDIAQTHVQEDAEFVLSWVREYPQYLDARHLGLSEMAPKELQERWGLHSGSPIFLATMKRMLTAEFGLEFADDRIVTNPAVPVDVQTERTSIKVSAPKRNEAVRATAAALLAAAAAANQR